MSSRDLRLYALSGLPLVQPGDDLVALLLEALQRDELHLRDGDVLVLAQKIVSKSENRLVRLDTVSPSSRALELARVVGKDPRLVELVLRESNEVVRHRRDLLVVEHRTGFVMANAGIDMSNVQQEDGDTVLLLPADPDGSCAKLRRGLQDRIGADVGVIINDSHGRAWRNGAVGVAIGAAGLPALQDLRGHPDLFGRRLLVTEVGTADEVAAAASLLMGQADEGAPVVVVRGLSFDRRKGCAAELIRPRHMDMFR